jgi:DNA-binding CsgD family transcriptional regulator/tetratricopeptide (TPR) repeat protein
MSEDELIGRRAELTVLRSAVDKAVRGHGGAVLVLGEAGIGKSRLLAAASRRARAAGMEALTGRAVAGGGAFRAIAAALADRLRDRSDSVSGGALLSAEELRPYLPALRRLLPAWTSDQVGSASGTESGADPIVVAGEGVLRLLRLLAADRGCLLVLEDLHWADADTLALVEYLAGAASSAGMLLVVSARDEGRERASIGRLAAACGAAVLRPRRLFAAETVALAVARAGGELSPERLDMVVGTADGLPLLVEELVAGLLRTQGETQGSRPVVPPTFAALVEQRLRDLPAAAAEITRAAAVLGADPPWTLLAEVTGHPESTTLAGLRAAAEIGLLVVEVGELRWRHALTCDAVVATVLPPERAPIARRAAELLLARRDPDDDAMAADLLVVAGEDERATALLLRLARRDLARGALRSAQELLDRVPGTGMTQLAGERVLLLTSLGRAADALDEGERALPSATGDVHAELCLRLARAAVRAGQWERARSYVERAGRPGDPRTPLLAADAAFGAGDVTKAGALAAEAIDLAERAKAAEPLCEALELVARCRVQEGDLAAAGSAFGRASSVAAEHGLLRQRVEAELGRALLAQFKGPWRPEHLSGVRELAVEAGMLAEVARIDLLLADGIWATEGPVAAEPVAKASAELAATLRLSSLQASVGTLLAGIHAAMGDVVGAGRLLESALAQPDRPPEVPAIASVVRAIPSLMAGDLARADTLMRPGMDAALAHPAVPPLAHWGLWTLLRAVCGEDGPARTLATLGAAGRRANQAALAYAEAVTAGRSGELTHAVARFTAGDRAGADTPWWSRLLRMLALHAAVADGWAEQVNAVGALRADLAEHERAGDHQLARTCRDLLRGAGAPTRRGRGTTPVPAALRAMGVTSREMDVLVLVAEGLTNAEVAGRLFLSRRTVETHVANLLAKTGATSRAELRTLLEAQTP